MTLLDRLEAATGPDRELDAEIHWQKLDGVGVGYDRNSPAYTASIDAAMTLVPEGWTAWEMRSHGKRTRYSVDLSRLQEVDAAEEDWAYSSGPTPALAICIAAIKARGEG